MPTVVISSSSSYSSRFSFRRPQRVAFELSYSGIGLAPCKASIISTWACISGQRSSAAMITGSPAAYHSGLCCWAVGSFMMYAAASSNVTIGFPFGGRIGSSKGRDQDTRKLSVWESYTRPEQ